MSESDVFERVRGIVAAIMSVPGDSVTPESSADTVDAWTSLRHLALALELEQEFGVALGPEDMEQLTSVAAIVEFLDERLPAISA